MHGLIANQWQRHEKRACHEDHRAKVGVRVVQQVGEEELLRVKIFQRPIFVILREKVDELIKSSSFFDQVVEEKGNIFPIQFLVILIQLCNISLESLKVLVNIDSQKFCDSLRSTSPCLNLTNCHF
jgi:hypothetical protein